MAVWIAVGILGISQICVTIGLVLMCIRVRKMRDGVKEHMLFVNAAIDALKDLRCKDIILQVDGLRRGHRITNDSME